MNETRNNELDADSKALEIYLKLGYSNKDAYEAFAKIFGNMNEKRHKMKGMKSTEFVEMINFIQKHHKFALCLSGADVTERQALYPEMGEYGFNIKYIDSCYDSRFADIWSVSFRGMGRKVCFHTNINLPLLYTTLFDWVMAYLKGEWKPTDVELKAILINEK